MRPSTKGSTFYFDITKPGHSVYNAVYNNFILWMMGFGAIGLPMLFSTVGLFMAPLADHDWFEFIVWGIIAVVVWPVFIYTVKNSSSQGTYTYSKLVAKFYSMPKWKQKEYAAYMHQHFVFLKHGDKDVGERLTELFDSYRTEEKPHDLIVELDNELQIARQNKELFK